MTEKRFQGIMSLLFIGLGVFATVNNERDYFIMSIIIANMWAISSSYKEES